MSTTQPPSDAIVRSDAALPQAFAEAVMTRLAALLWIVGGTVVVGAGAIVMLSIPSLPSEALSFVPLAAIAGNILGVNLASAKGANQGAQS
jgi:hypothetical protein